MPYLPQIAAIVIGRASGLGPLGLLYAARLANGVAALLLVAAALWILPVGNMALLVMGLTPRVLFEFASASPDAAVIATAFLFTAIATRARFRGRWHGWEALTACIAGAVFCSLKPVYAPLLLIGLPGALRYGLARHVIAVHAIIIVVVLGVTAAWLHYGLPSLLVTREGTSVSRQLTEILAHPVTFVITMLRTVEVYGRSWVLNAIGLLWADNPVAEVDGRAADGLGGSEPAVATASGTAYQRGGGDVAHGLFGASAVLILTALYLHFTVVGAGVIEGVQGRYFCPLSALLAVTLGGLAARLPPIAWAAGEAGQAGDAGHVGDGGGGDGADLGSRGARLPGVLMGFERDSRCRGLSRATPGNGPRDAISPTIFLAIPMSFCAKRGHVLPADSYLAGADSHPPPAKVRENQDLAVYSRGSTTARPHR